MAWTRFIPALLALGALVALSGATLAQEDEDEGVTIEEGDGTLPPETEEEEEEEVKPKPGPQRKTPFPRRTSSKRPKMVPRGDKTYAIDLPEDWLVEDETVRNAALGFRVTLPGTTKPTRLAIFERTDQGDPRVLPFGYRESTVKNYSATSSEIRQKPLPQLLCHFKSEGADWIGVTAFRGLRGYAYMFSFDCPKAEFDIAHRDLLAAVASFESKADRYPEIPKKYKLKKKGRYLFACHPRVKASLKPAEKILAAQEKRFTKVHGKLPKPMKDEPVVIFVHNTKSQAADLYKPAADSQSDFLLDTRNQRLFIVPVRKGNREQAGTLAMRAQALFWLLKYASNQPLWAYIGEGDVGRGEQMTGKSLPSLFAGLANWASQTALTKLDKLEDQREKNWESYEKQAFFYVCMFRAGKSKYRKAYKAMLKQLEETYDGKAAEKAFFDSLDLAKTQNDATDFMLYKIKPITPKQ